MKPYYADEAVTLYHGDSRERLMNIHPAGPDTEQETTK